MCFEILHLNYSIPYLIFDDKGFPCLTSVSPACRHGFNFCVYCIPVNHSQQAALPSVSLHSETLCSYCPHSVYLGLHYFHSKLADFDAPSPGMLLPFFCL